MKLIDLSHVVHDGLETYPGLPVPSICDYWSREDTARRYAEGTSFQIARLDMVANTGTYIDAPFHRYEDGPDVAAVELERVAELPGVLVTAPAGERAIGPAVFDGVALEGRAVLVRTGHSRHWESPAYFEHHPFLTAAAAEYLRHRDAALVGIDSLNIDDTRGDDRPVHSALLGAGILIVEHLCNLDALAEAIPSRGDFTFTAAPVKVRGMGSFPVRAFATVRASKVQG